jgi:rhamnosyltransferase
MSLHKPDKKNICAVFVTFHPDDGLASRVERIARQVETVVIVDNHSGEPSAHQLRDLCSTVGASLIENTANHGIATALNQAALWAKQRGYEWLLTLDQDTVVADDMVAALMGVYETFPEQEMLAIIGSNYKDAKSGTLFVPSRLDNHYSWQETKTVITSGSLCSLAVYSVIGPFREDFFIDCVDFEYCLRARSRGFRIVLALKPLMEHSIGATSIHRLPWKTTGTSNHPPLRRYYMARNHLTLLREYVFTEPAWVCSSLYSFLKSTILMCLFEEEKMPKLKYSATGVVEGLFSTFTRRYYGRKP